MSDKSKPSQLPPHTASDAIPHVPGELLDNLHTANQEFSQARREREEAVDLPVYTHTPMDQAKHHVREAEKEVEAVTENIDDIIHDADKTSKSE